MTLIINGYESRNLVINDNQERYANQDAYVEAVKAAAQRFVKERLLLPEDAELNIERAKADKLSQIR